MGRGCCEVPEEAAGRMEKVVLDTNVFVKVIEREEAGKRANEFFDW